ncbi:hypothetical protein MLD38_007464 [Melastoma candidum]|uniref:Uncharacterized protein n=1 Tax=Melastoma candidum TaxID=119954 RepID=A0ACB9RSF8_9MYRT|nr:hypothetical protein MLD38_007464 [Melastoma candidum]
MGRGKVELKRIENKINRKVTFAKRKNELLKKAYELSVLCEAEVTLIFSARGKVHEFCSSPQDGNPRSILKTIEKYHRYNYAEMEATEDLNLIQEYVRLKVRVDELQQMQRNMRGEQLGEMSMNELERLENKIDKSLKQVRSTKEYTLLEAKRDLKRKVNGHNMLN